MDSPTHRTVEANGIRIHFAEQGEGPLVLLCHGFPESWYSWRHQLRALADAGFRVVAPDMRGYGRTDRPREIDQYTIFHLVGDMVGLLDALGEQTAVIAGHDWGAPVAWQAARLRPDRFRALIALSVPFMPRGSLRPTSVMPQTDAAMFYQLYFQPPGIAEQELERDVRRSLRVMLWAWGPEAPNLGRSPMMVPRGGGFLDGLPEPEELPDWLAASDLDIYAAEFERTGFAGALNWYRNIDRNWALQGAFTGMQLMVPALYVAGDQDLVLAFPGVDQLVKRLSSIVSRLEGPVILPGCGHWTQQERPADVNTAMIEFLRRL